MTDSPEKPKEKIEKEQEIEFGQLFDSILKGYGIDGTPDTQKVANDLIAKFLSQTAAKHKISKDYNIAVIYDSTTMVKSDADNIYSAVTAFKEKKPLLLILYSNGGVIGSAYLIGQLCREYSNSKFVITVPRHAKSSATLLCCAGDEIHMGSLSELGPIDPQINGLPALGLKNSIEHIAHLVKEIPESAEMFARYLHYSVKPIDLGYYERVAESAMQYAEKLLASNENKLPHQINKIAYDLVYNYKDHGFVLDKNESMKIFGNKIVKINTDEYNLGNSIYNDLSMVKNILGYFDYNFYMIGSLSSEPIIIKNK